MTVNLVQDNASHLNIVKLNSKTFQPERIIYGKEEKINFR